VQFWAKLFIKKGTDGGGLIYVEVTPLLPGEKEMQKGE
jgi:hypothetical protein